MIRFATLPVLLVLCMAFPTHVRSAPSDKYGPFEIGDRDEPMEDHLQVFTKTFLVAMRNHHGDKNANALRGFFDPRYLKKHDLMDCDLSATLAPIGRIFGYEFADDKQTILCLVDTDVNPREPVQEAILLRYSVYEEKLYLSPPKAPDAKAGTVTPWILRTKLKVLQSK